ncbi:hypothetical protein FJT64_002476 [Amphibalanus amphitrite]|uniref:Apple domain-containing protein n=1 Tax=Amphibalanus amphitrite TaxID=1232801 RepID=A0A6A4WTZ4_AMPAM|nr:hypothetical protein FJT64_002476 [Amphibalanus amphitrite]
MLPATVSLLLVAALASADQRFELRPDRPPAAWLRRTPAVSLVDCASRCARTAGCRALVWAADCGLAESTGSDSPTAALVPVYTVTSAAGGSTGTAGTHTAHRPGERDNRRAGASDSVHGGKYRCHYHTTCECHRTGSGERN